MQNLTELRVGFTSHVSSVLANKDDKELRFTWGAESNGGELSFLECGKLGSSTILFGSAQDSTLMVSANLSTLEEAKFSSATAKFKPCWS